MFGFFNEFIQRIAPAVLNTIRDCGIARPRTPRFIQTGGPAPHYDLQGYGRTLVRANEKVGRNEPCPCGSGEKNKKCCGS